MLEFTPLDPTPAFYDGLQIKMTKSVLEQELTRKLYALRGGMAKHDRAVLLGFIFSLVPLFPVALLGFVVSAFNYSLYKSGKLELGEKNMIVAGMLVGAINAALGGALFYYFVTRVGGIDWPAIAEHIFGMGRSFLDHLPLRWPSKENVEI